MVMGLFLQRAKNGSRSRQSGPKYLDRRPLSGRVEDPSKCSKDRMLSRSVNLGALGRPFGLPD